MPKIVVSRTSQYVNSMREYDIYIDNEKVDVINDGEKKIIEVSEGNHEIYIKIDWCKSKKLNMNLTEGQDINLKCGSEATGIKQVFALVYLFLPYKFVYLDYLLDDEEIYNDNKVSNYSRIKDMGMREFVLKCGIIRFGIPTAIIYSILMVLLNSNINSIRSFITNTIINLLVFTLVGGSLFGFTMWKYMKSKNA
ncbi:hypothetical protein [Inconstantimicrobium mannanitabidum]|uniref:Uncharacterized protein n=1 Tax=Inconstantimicrobium mannanitabidum TaxID=1604901 RepID=A0ACB5R8Z8_9CLOT|nr:hypothetical protein [Clostridium sp. TW13]GKX65669.1 hypothetical protein rsdtw13_09270 [Clostridium sp. TW13]